MKAVSVKMLVMIVWTIASCLFNARSVASINVSDDKWVLTNIMRNVSNYTATELGLFNPNSTNTYITPCDWNFVTCNNRSRVIALDLDFSPAEGDYIDTTYWPTMIEEIHLYIGRHYDSDINVGKLILDHLPMTIQYFHVRGKCLDLNLTAFANISHLSNMHTLYIDLYDSSNYIGVATNLGSKLPQNLQDLHLEQFTMDKFPNFVNFRQLKWVSMQYSNITNDATTFVSSTLPQSLKHLDLSGAYGIIGDLDFRSLMPYSPSLAYINLHTWGDDGATFSSVNFRGINDNTTVYLSSGIGCTINSIYGEKNESISSYRNYACVNERTLASCTGEQECLSTCQCFEISQDWHPALNDFYTYV